jgi:hypothetical protein
MNRWSRCCAVWLVIALPALGAENAFDGTYTGKRVLTKGADRTCPTEDDVSVTIRGETLTFTNSKVRAYVVGFEPHPDGSFREASTDIGGAIVSIEGRIVGGVLDADVSTPSCQHHWHLRRS